MNEEIWGKLPHGVIHAVSPPVQVNTPALPSFIPGKDERHRTRLPRMPCRGRSERAGDRFTHNVYIVQILKQDLVKDLLVWWQVSELKPRREVSIFQGRRADYALGITERCGGCIFDEHTRRAIDFTPDDNPAIG